MMDNSVADNSAVIAFLMEATNASIEDVMMALENCGGNDQKALELLTSGGANQNAASGTAKEAISAKLPRSLVDEDAEMVAAKAPLRSDQGGSKRPATGKKYHVNSFC
jgi:translation elongation factor EF-Ts